MDIGVVAGQSGHTAPFVQRLVARGATVAVLPVRPGDEEPAAGAAPVMVCARIEELVERSSAVLVLEDRADGAAHAELVEPVLAAGRHVFVDKPLAADLASAQAMMDAARARGVALMSSSSARYAEPVRRLRSVARDSGLTSVTITGPGELWFYGVHLAEIAVTVLGPGFRTAQCLRDDQGWTARLCHSSGAVVTVGLEPAAGVLEGFSLAARGPRTFGAWPLVDYGPWYDLLVDDVLLMARTGTPPVDPVETLEVVRLLDAIERSAGLGAATSLEDA